MESRFRRDLMAWLAADPALAAGLNGIGEESPLSAPPPWLGLAASASAEWGAKEAPGREVRVALEMVLRGDDPDVIAALSDALERRVTTMPPDQGGYRVAVTQFLRSRAERRVGNLRAVVSEWRFLILAYR